METAAGGSAEIKTAPTGTPARLFLSGALLFHIFCQHQNKKSQQNYWVNQRKSNSRRRPACPRLDIFHGAEDPEGPQVLPRSHLFG